MSQLEKLIAAQVASTAFGACLRTGAMTLTGFWLRGAGWICSSVPVIRYSDKRLAGPL